jgi:hypothetical protein
MKIIARCVASVLLCLGATTGCDDAASVTETPDASVGKDASTPVDAGTKPDSAAPHDAGAKEDAAEPEDAAVVKDAGLEGVDAGPNHGFLCPTNAKDHATAALKELHDHWFTAGNWTSCLWWHQANLLETVANFAGYAHDTTYNADFDPIYAAQDLNGLLSSNSFDDTQWVSLSWARADDVAPHAQYLQRAKQFYEYAANAWDDTKCGGGMWWSGKRDYKNAITNELFIVSSMKLYEKTHEQRYLENAKKTWKWFDQSGMINGDGLVNDGLVTATCKNNGQTTRRSSIAAFRSSTPSCGHRSSRTESCTSRASSTLKPAIRIRCSSKVSSSATWDTSWAKRIAKI